VIVRRLEECEKTDRRVVTPGWESTRLLLKNDGMGYSVHVTTIYKGSELPMEYRNHLEAVYGVSGEGEIEETQNGKIHQIRPGTIYALDKHDKHILRARTELKLVCVFNPPLHGKEVHDEEGVYPLEAEECSAP
jgi:L-ectoine synthase